MCLDHDKCNLFVFLFVFCLCCTIICAEFREMAPTLFIITSVPQPHPRSIYHHGPGVRVPQVKRCQTVTVAGYLPNETQHWCWAFSVVLNDECSISTLYMIMKSPIYYAPYWWQLLAKLWSVLHTNHNVWLLDWFCLNAKNLVITIC